MTSLVLPHDIVNLTPADATLVQQDFEQIEQYVNDEVITRDGTVAMQAPLLLVGDPTQSNQAATKDYVDAVLPIGVIFLYGGLNAPAGGQWALCNGAGLQISAYPELHGVLGTNYGAGAAGVFNLPNLIGRFPIGVDSAQTDINTLGKTGGTTTPPLKTHTHKIDHNHATFDTGSSPSMTHEHSIDHNHASFTTLANSGSHDHPILTREGGTPGAGSQLMEGTTPGGVPSSIRTVLDGTSEHAHAIDVPPFDGLSGPGNLGTHTHAVDVPAFVGNSAVPVQTVDTSYRPPFQTVSYIIRIK